MRICLVNPPKTYQVWAGVPDIFNGPDAYLFPPLGIMYLSAHLKAHTNHEVHLYDCVERGWTADEVARRIAAVRPQVLGVTANSHNLVNVREVIDAVRRRVPDVFVTIGGSHVTSFPEEAALFPGSNAAIRGDGEDPLTELLDHLEKGTDWRGIKNLSYLDDKGRPVVNEKVEPTKDLDRYPFPDREGLFPDRYYTPGMKEARATTIMSSRGCPFNCTFCNVPHRYRTRSAKNIVDEMEYCRRQLGIKEFHFIDDIFNITVDRVNEISEEILARKLEVYWGYKAGCIAVDEKMLALARKAGCIRMHYGVETWSDDGLVALQKKAREKDIRRAFKLTRKAGIRPIAYMIAGCPHEKSPKDVLSAIPFVKSLRPDYVVFSLYTPYPDAPVFQEGVERGLWDADCWRRFMVNPTREYDLPTVWNEHMDKDTLVKLLKQVHNRFYFSPGVLVRTTLSMRTVPEVVRLVRGGLILLKLQFLPAASRRI
jgi:anaerobic magnesium-protoporphyrin IX monomethyl ester cyclase